MKSFRRTTFCVWYTRSAQKISNNEYSPDSGAAAEQLAKALSPNYSLRIAAPPHPPPAAGGLIILIN